MHGIIGNKISLLDTIDSTNNFLKEKLKTDRPEEGFLVSANEQITGRGQRENSWESASFKNLILSFIVYPGFIKVDKQFILSKTISLAIAKFLSRFVKNVCIKWPNDIYVKDKKIAGVLIESAIKGFELTHSIIGIGININQKHFSEYLPNPTSLKTITKKNYGINELLFSLINDLNFWYDKLIMGQISEIDNSYLNILYRYKQTHSFIIENKKIDAKITGIESDGRLIIETDAGQIKKFAFKEIKYCIGDVGELS